MVDITDSLFGTTCVRCGTRRTRSKLEDVPTCSDCEKTFLQTKVASEDTRCCPIDGAAMKKEIVHKLVIDRCPQCSGVWLDVEELKAVEKAASQEGYSSGALLGMAIG